MREGRLLGAAVRGVGISIVLTSVSWDPYIYIIIYMYIYMCMYVCMYVCIYIYIYMYTYINIYPLTTVAI